jgi:hemerythrin
MAERAGNRQDIDDQHREMLRRFNKLVKACYDGFGKDEIRITLLFLGDYVRDHFNAEEDLQERFNFPGYAAHREMHAAFTKKFKALEHQLLTEGATLPLVIQTTRILSDWLREHISGADSELAEFLKART